MTYLGPEPNFIEEYGIHYLNPMSRINKGFRKARNYQPTPTPLIRPRPETNHRRQ